MTADSWCIAFPTAPFPSLPFYLSSTPEVEAACEIRGASCRWSCLSSLTGMVRFWGCRMSAGEVLEYMGRAGSTVPCCLFCLPSSLPPALLHDTTHLDHLATRPGARSVCSHGRTESIVPHSGCPLCLHA